MTNDGNFNFNYDYDNRLVEVITPTQTINYTYDPFGRRIEKEITVDGGLSTVDYVYDGDNLIAEYDADGNLTAKYIHGPKIDEIISLTTNHQTPATNHFCYWFDIETCLFYYKN